MSSEAPSKGLAIVGGGPSAFGLLTYAYRHGRLDALTRAGLVLFERSRSLGGGALSGYLISSNSWAEAFLHHCLDSDDARFRRLARSDEAQALLAYKGRPFPLPVGAAFLGRLAATIAALVEARDGCAVLLGAEVDRIVRRREGGWCVEGAEQTGRFRYAARKVILATGGLQAPLPGLERHAGKMVTAASVIEADDARLSALVPPSDPRPIVVLGGSHSALSAAKRLFDRDGASGAPIAIVHRSPLRFYFASEDEAAASGFPAAPRQICALSGRVNRFSGLRYDALDFARACLDPATAEGGRVRFRHVPVEASGDGEIVALLDQASLIVQAFGFGRRPVALFDEHGASMQPRIAADGAYDVSDEGRLVSRDGEAIADLFAIGLGAGLRTSGAIGGETDRRVRVDGVWMYQNDAAGAVLEPLLAELESQQLKRR